jgi:hypothetical protein
MRRASDRNRADIPAKRSTAGIIMPRPVSTAQSTLPLRWYWIARALGSGTTTVSAVAL